MKQLLLAPQGLFPSREESPAGLVALFLQRFDLGQLLFLGREPLGECSHEEVDWVWGGVSERGTRRRRRREARDVPSRRRWKMRVAFSLLGVSSKAPTCPNVTGSDCVCSWCAVVAKSVAMVDT